jgi:hypothetical protein
LKDIILKRVKMNPMKFSQDSKFLILILVFTLIVSVINGLGILNFSATARDEHEPHDDWHTANMDSFISERLNDSNYGDEGYLKIGNAVSGQNITYLYFNLLSYDTSTARKADLYIYATNVAQETVLKVHIADSDAWDEAAITWNNAPTYGDSIAQKTVSSPGFVTIDVSSVLIDSNVPEITLVITTESLSRINIRSIENEDTRMEDEFPHIIFIREIVPGFDIFTITSLISLVIILLSVRFKKHKKIKIEP